MNPLSLEKIFESLNAANVRYLVVGGLAVMAHGYLRTTRDLDLVIALDGDNPASAISVFKSLGYKPNVPVQMSDFSSVSKRTEWIQSKNMQVFQLVSEELMDCPVDIFAEEPFDFAEMYSSRVDFELSKDCRIPVVGLKHLRAMKNKAGRPRDLLDLEELDMLEDFDGKNT